MVIHGVEIQLHSVQVEDTDIGRFYIHDTLDDEESDLHYLFKDVDSLWKGTFFSLGFSKYIGIDGRSTGISLDPDEFPGCVIRIDYEPQVALIKGEGFGKYGSEINKVHMGVYAQVPDEHELSRDQWDMELSEKNWPEKLRAYIYLTYDETARWFFSTQRVDVDTLIAHHAGNPKVTIREIAFSDHYPEDLKFLEV